MTKLGLALIVPLALALVVLAVWPELDLDAARLFYTGDHHFIGNTPMGVVLRYIAWGFPFFVFGVLLIAWMFRQAGLVPAGWAPSGRAILILTLSLAIGPGVLVNGLFKLTAHRPRPYSVTAFDGPDIFRPFTKFDGACRRSCSFPSAETASATWVLAPASLVPPPWRGPALAAAIVYAAATALGRMAFGGHFLSDVCAAALITILVILACRRAIALSLDKIARRRRVG